jgi:glycosyltransferase involved in cell wall biosynthesis
VKIAIVVQRYGLAINGGAEAHARYIAERLARHMTVDVLTTCAVDYVTWRNELPAGVEQVNNVSVRRFAVKRERDPLTFSRLSERVFEHQHSISDELDWLDAEGPTCPALVSYLSKHERDYDFCIFFSYRYYHAFHGVRAVAHKAILVPTAERDAAIGLSIFKPIFRGVRALMYNSPEERTMIRAVADNAETPSVVVGVGSEIPANPQASRFRQKYNIRGPFAIYVGRIDENKGCKELFDYFETYLKAQAGRLSLVLIGNSILDIPANPHIRHLGFVDDADKFDAIAAAELLVMPSYFESLSMVALEAWALGRPVLVNAKCDVLKGQCLRSNAGLYYDNGAEFVEALAAIEHNRWVSAALGRNGRQFYRNQYDMPVIEHKYREMLDRLSKSPAKNTIEPLPGWMERRTSNCSAGSRIVAALPAGATVVPEDMIPRAADMVPPLPHRHVAERGRPASNRDRRSSGAPRRGPSRPASRR